MDGELPLTMNYPLLKAAHCIPNNLMPMGDSNGMELHSAWWCLALFWSSSSTFKMSGTIQLVLQHETDPP